MRLWKIDQDMYVKICYSPTCVLMWLGEQTQWYSDTNFKTPLKPLKPHFKT